MVMGTYESTFQLHHRTLDGAFVLVLSGELDAWADQELAPRAAVLLARAGPDVVVDLRDVTFLDAGGLRLLLRIRERVLFHGGRVRLVRGEPRVWRVLRLTGVDSVFDVVDGLPAPH